MILDSSAVVAIVRRESTSEALLAVVLRTPVRRISAANLLETYIVVDRDDNGLARPSLDRFLSEYEVRTEAVTSEHVAIARVVYQRFGKRSGHSAGLNFGDCFAYALAQAVAEPLLFVGNDFAATDVAPTWSPAPE